jgi:hypothetical protein
MTHIVNDNGINRPMTDAEIAELKVIQDSATKRLEEQKQAEAAKLVAQAKLAALGLTADDLKALGLGNN